MVLWKTEYYTWLCFQRLPPLSTDPTRCERAFVGNTIGQANGVYDKAIDLRFCDYTNDKSNLKGKTLSAALMSDAKFDGADMSEVVMSKAYAVGASFKGTSRILSVIILVCQIIHGIIFILNAKFLVGSLQSSWALFVSTKDARKQIEAWFWDD